MPAICDTFASSLQRRRERFNARFAQARSIQPSLEPANFQAHLAASVDPIVSALPAGDAATIDATVEALFDASLDMVSGDLLGLGSRHPAIEAGWSRLLTALAARVAQGPQRVVTSLSNALYNLATAPGARPAQWVERMIDVGRHCDGIDDLLAAGQVLAWTAGMAGYRQGALKRCRTLAPQIARAALRVDDEQQDVAEMIRQLEADPWLDPAHIGKPRQPDAPHVVARVGGFRGFGGPFGAPPTVVAHQDYLIAREGQRSWRIEADRFGCAIHPVNLPQRDAPPSKAGGTNSVTSSGKVTLGEQQAALPELAQATSQAFLDPTLAVTVPYSHHVYLITTRRCQVDFSIHSENAT